MRKLLLSMFLGALVFAGVGIAVTTAPETVQADTLSILHASGSIRANTASTTLLKYCDLYGGSSITVTALPVYIRLTRYAGVTTGATLYEMQVSTGTDKRFDFRDIEAYGTTGSKTSALKGIYLASGGIHANVVTGPTSGSGALNLTCNYR